MIITSPPRCRNRTSRQRSHALALAESPRNSGLRADRPQPRGFVSHTRLWEPGRTLWISFLGAPDRSLKMAIFELACQWIELSEANLEFDLSEDDDANAPIRILTGKAALLNESDIGTDALAHRDETISLTVQPGDARFQSTVLHEFGHALGFEHEHLHPEANIPWNTEALFAAYRAVPNWSDDDVREQYLNVHADVDLLKTGYDPLSIMHYEVAQWQTHDDFETGHNTELSAKDIELMRLAYPHD